MALLYLKRALFGPRDQHKYSALGSSNSSDADLESHASSSSYDASISEKQPTAPSTTPSSRLFDPRIISDATLGLSDGLTVPFALTAGLSHFGDSKIVIYGGLAELLAGSLSMGLGGYLGSKSESESAKNTQRSVLETVRSDPARTHELVTETLRDESWALPPELLDAVTTHMIASEERCARFLTRLREGVDEPDVGRAYISAVTIALSYFCGGFVPLVPYFFLHHVRDALGVSVLVMGVALFAFGVAKTRLAGERRGVKALAGGVQMVVLGGLAAAVAVGCVKGGVVWEGEG